MKNEYEPAEAAGMEAVVAELRWQGRCLSVLAAATVGVLLYLLRPVLVPFVVALFFTVGLKPILDLLQRSLLPSRIAAVAAAFLLGLVLLLALGGAVASSIDQLATNDAYQRRAAAAAKQLATFADRFNLLPPADGDEDKTSLNRLQLAARRGAKTAQDWLLGGMVSLFGSLGVVLIYMLFLLLGASQSANQDSELWRMVEGKLREYIVLKTVISVGTGVAVWMVLALFQVPLALLLGMLTFLLNYIPNFGPLATCVLPLPLIWLHPDLSLASMIAASVLSCGVQLVGGNIVEPRMMGSSFDLHPIVVLLSLMVWYAIWGFVGMLLAVPMTAALKGVLQRIERTEPVARLLAGDLTALSVGSRVA
ncbi:AI-2 transport protein TqsA [Pirellulimonas nuda]|uniref:AI-2 transport protein TqsA n=1 Tax=Pirellulimonas nuda TaxID=2528009 RepID=A0A518DCL3_9BACT|nr:AI-2E family transporter [Pirellulimonas nuda]QDU89215.1 AI-2 transport protein TqsA [Pirellulimonas nuda]